MIRNGSLFNILCHLLRNDSGVGGGGGGGGGGGISGIFVKKKLNNVK